MYDMFAIVDDEGKIVNIEIDRDKITITPDIRSSYEKEIITGFGVSLESLPFEVGSSFTFASSDLKTREYKITAIYSSTESKEDLSRISTYRMLSYTSDVTAANLFYQDTEEIDKELDQILAEANEQTEDRCECGAEKCGSKIHSDWCPLCKKE